MNDELKEEIRSLKERLDCAERHIVGLMADTEQLRERLQKAADALSGNTPS